MKLAEVIEGYEGYLYIKLHVDISNSSHNMSISIVQFSVY